MPNPIHKGGRPTPTTLYWKVIGHKRNYTLVILKPDYDTWEAAYQEAHGRNERFAEYPKVLAWAVRSVSQRRKVGR